MCFFCKTSNADKQYSDATAIPLASSEVRLTVFQIFLCICIYTHTQRAHRALNTHPHERVDAHLPPQVPRSAHTLTPLSPAWQPGLSGTGGSLITEDGAAHSLGDRTGAQETQRGASECSGAAPQPLWP